MNYKLIAPEVQVAAVDAGLRFDGSGAGLPSALIASGSSILVDKSIVKAVRLQHYDAARKLLLIEVRQASDSGFAIAGVSQGRAFVAHTLPAQRVSAAMESVLPAEVVQAKEAGKTIFRQGSWFFFPFGRSGKVQVFHFHPLDDDHVAEQVAVPKYVASHVYVFGMVTHPEHRTLYFDKWHRAVRVARIA